MTQLNITRSNAQPANVPLIIPLRYKYERGSTSKLQPCPGFYCARVYQDDGSWSACGPCPRGYNRDENFACVPCSDSLQLYDWLYLGFMCILPFLLHLNSIDSKILKTRHTLGLILISILGISISSISTLLLLDPVGELEVTSCGSGSHTISDWYPLFYNPQPNYEETLHCSHEVVYPLFTIVLVFYGIADLSMLLLGLIGYLLKFQVGKFIYAGLYFYPVLALGHLLLGGVIHAIFPFITVLASVISCSYHFAKRANQDLQSLIIESVTDWKNLGTILCHWCLHSYGIISIMELAKYQRDLTLLALVPLPAILYILTVNFTDPGKLHGD